MSDMEHRVSINEKGPDLVPYLKEYTMTPFRAVQHFPEDALPIVEGLQMADLKRAQDTMELRDIAGAIGAGFSGAEQVAISKIARGEATSEDDRLNLAAKQVRSVFEHIRDMVKEYYRKMYRRNLTAKDLKAFEYVVDDGMHPIAAAVKADSDFNNLMDHITAYNEIDNWGLDDFITKMELGSLRITKQEIKEDKEGKETVSYKTIAFAPNRRQAFKKALRILEEHPEWNITLDMTREYEEALRVEVGKKHYWGIIGKLDKALKEEADWLTGEMRKEKVRKAVGKVITIKPNLVAPKALKERKDILQGEENIFDILPAYIGAVMKKINLDPAISDSKDYIGDGQKPQQVRKLIENLVKDLKGTYSPLDAVADGILGMMYKSTGKAMFDQPPGQYSRMVASARQLQAYLKLGYRPITGFINAVVGNMHTIAATSGKVWKAAIDFRKSAEGKEFIHNNKEYMGFGFAEEVAGTLKTRLSKIDPLYYHQAPEPFNREICLCANYLYAKAQGMDEVTATQYARRGVWFQQFTYNVGSLPRAMRGPTGRLVFQFKPYLVKELEFLSNLTRGQLIKYASMQILMFGPAAFMTILRSIPFLGLFWGFDDLEEWMNRSQFHRVAHGLTGAGGSSVGVDVSAAAAFQFPSRPEDWFGPTLSDSFRLYSNVIGPAMAGRFENTLPSIGRVATGHFEELGYRSIRRKEMFRWMRDSIPVMYYWDQLITTAISEDGSVLDDRGRPLYKPEWAWADYVKFISGMRPLELSRARKAERFVIKEEDARELDKRMYVDSILDTLEAGGTLDEDVMQRYIEAGGSAESIREGAKARHLPPYLRRILATQKMFRPDVAERLIAPE